MEYSNKDFTGRTLIEADDLNDQTIYNSCFSQETPNSNIFPATMRNVIFKNCNLDNVFIPVGNEVTDCSTRKYSAQNDGNDWELGEDNKPFRLLNYLILDKLGIDQPTPDQIPNEPVGKFVDYTDTLRNVRAD